MNDPPRPGDAPHVGRFFDALQPDYDAAIARCMVRYGEMLSVLLAYLPPDFTPGSILELGCGTGNLSVLLFRRFPAAALRLVDLSGASLESCRRRLGSDTRVTYEQEDFRRVVIPPASVDLVVSSIAIHHLEADEKRALFRRLHAGLRRHGVFTYADQFAGATDDLYQQHMQQWRQTSMAAGASEEEWEMWMEHQQEMDHHDTLTDQMAWLREAGFVSIDCPWRFLLWTVLQARKGAS